MKPDLTLSEQKERETIASRVYAATAAWVAAAEAYRVAYDAEREAWRVYMGDRDLYVDGYTESLAATEASRLTHMLVQSVVGQAVARRNEAWAEREQAMKAEKDFRARMDARPDLTCEGCGAPATVLWDGEGFCGDCNAMLETEARMREDEQQADYARTRGV